MFRRMWSLITGRVVTGPAPAPEDAAPEGAVGEEMELSDWYPRLMADPRVTAIQYSAMRDDDTCEHCQALDGVAFTKEAWLRVEPPTACRHGEECRCMGIGILADESPQPTIVDVAGLASLGVTRADGSPV